MLELCAMLVVFTMLSLRGSDNWRLDHSDRNPTMAFDHEVATLLQLQLAKRSTHSGPDDARRF